jgi:hypothetical protein
VLSNINFGLAMVLIVTSWLVLSRVLARLSAPAPTPTSIGNRTRKAFPEPAGPVNPPVTTHRVSVDQL